MKIEKAIKKYCTFWKHSPCVIKSEKNERWNINIQFLNNNGDEDETQIDIKQTDFDYDAERCPKLVESWQEFCFLNGIKQNSVVGIAIVNNMSITLD